MTRYLPLLCVLLAATLATACDTVPRDPRNTLVGVLHDTLRVGYVVDPPWVLPPAGEGAAPGGVEPELVHDFARELGAEVLWLTGTEAELMERLARYELDLVVGGLSRSSPYGREVSLTLPYWGWQHDLPRDQRVMAVPPGENAWLVRLERYLHDARPRAVELVEHATS